MPPFNTIARLGHLARICLHALALRQASNRAWLDAGRRTR
jgi:hypothetical protein